MLTIYILLLSYIGDKLSDKVCAYFEWVKDYTVIEDDNTQVILCHFPIAHWHMQYHGSIHLYGHIHNNIESIAFSEYSEICKKYNIPFE